MKRIACALGSGLLVCLFAWLAGFDFNERGFKTFVVAYSAVSFMALVYFFPNWKAGAPNA
jgi:hypothetical protein